MITVDTIVAMAIRDRTVIDQLGAALRSDLCLANPFYRRIAEFADDFCLRTGNLPGDGDWAIWLESLPVGLIQDGSREALGRLFGINLASYTPAYFAEQALGHLQATAATVARSRLNEIGEVKPETFTVLAEQLKAIQGGGLHGLARLADLDTWAHALREDALLPTGFPTLDRWIGGWGKELWIVFADSGVGKALDVDTPIPTPQGWTCMGDLRRGDTIFDEQGRQCRVVATTRIMHDRPCYELTFSDGSTLVADAKHLWSTRCRNAKARARRDAARTTEEIAVDTWTAGQAVHSVAVAGPLEGSTIVLPIDPYALGVWLGDGNSHEAQISCADPQIVEEIRRSGECVRRIAGNYRYAIGTGARSGWRGKITYAVAEEIRACVAFGLSQKDVALAYDLSPSHVCALVAGRSRKKEPPPVSFAARLRALHLLGNKHLPLSYLRANPEQRLALLQGLMDTDGTVTKHGRCSFSTTSVALRNGVRELMRSLGLQVHAVERRARLYGKDCGPAWVLNFTAHRDRLPVFRLARKLERLRIRPPHHHQSTRHAIVAVRWVRSRPVRCIQVDAPSSLYLAGASMVPTHNSMILANWATAAALRGKRVLHVTLELGLRPQIHRYYRQLTQMEAGQFGAAIDTAKERLRHWFRLVRGEILLLEYPAYSITPDDLKRMVDRVERTLGAPDVLVLDYLDLVSLPPRAQGRSDYADLGRITHEVRSLCPTSDLTVLTASQAVRRPERAGRLTVRDMGDSYQKVRGADGLLSLVQTDEEEEVHQGRLGILKVRDSGGRGQEVPLYINRELSFIQELLHPNTVELMARLGHHPAAPPAKSALAGVGTP